jgi:tripartite-type tricarboxylate transporter receptor subunit TctC
MKRAFAIVASLVAACTLSVAASAQSGSQPLRIIVPYPPGGTTDMMARLTAQKLGELSGQQSIVENRPGAGGNIGTQAVARAPRDGLTVGISAVNTFAINPHLVKDLPYDPARDLEPICLVGFMPNIIVVNPGVPARSLAELIALAKKQPLSFSSPGSGTSVHLAGELLNEGAGISLQHVPYKGDAPALQDVLGGRIEVMVANLPGAIEHVRAGKLRPIAVTAAQRSPLLPEVPTVEEQGVAPFDVSAWFLFFAPAGIPADRMGALVGAFRQALQQPDLREKLARAGVDVQPLPPQEVKALMAADSKRYGALIRKLNLAWQ